MYAVSVTESMNNLGHATVLVIPENVTDANIKQILRVEYFLAFPS